MKTLIICVLLASASVCHAETRSDDNRGSYGNRDIVSLIMPGKVEMYLYLAPNGSLIATPEKFHTVQFTYLCSRIVDSPVFEVSLPKVNKHNTPRNKYSWLFDPSRGNGCGGHSDKRAVNYGYLYYNFPGFKYFSRVSLSVTMKPAESRALRYL